MENYLSNDSLSYLDRDILHNVSSSILKNNWGGALYYVSAGEVNPRFTMEKNQIIGNCVRLYGNFSTCESAVTMDLQNTQNVYFRVSKMALDKFRFRSRIVSNGFVRGFGLE